MPSLTAYIVLSTQRVGSHLLGDVIGSHPDFAHAGEVLMPNTPKPGSFDAFVDGAERSSDADLIWRDYLAHLQTIRKPGARYVGFLVKYDDVDRIGGKDFTSDPLFERLRIIHLVRRNLLRTIASHHLAVARKVHVTNQVMRYNINNVELPADEVVRTLQRKAARVQGFRERLTGRPHALDIAYEDIMDGELVSEKLITRLCAFFDVADRFVRRPNTVKLAPERLRTLIRNYDEVAAAVNGTEFQEMLD